MSHANGRVKFDDGAILHFEYNGTADMVCNCLYFSYDDMVSAWRNQQDQVCECGNAEPVEIATDYGSGSQWPGMACRHCMAITMGLGTGLDESLYDIAKAGLPGWWTS